MYGGETFFGAFFLLKCCGFSVSINPKDNLEYLLLVVRGVVEDEGEEPKHEDGEAARIRHLR